MRRTLTAVLLAAMLAFSPVAAYADPGIGEEQYGGLQEAVDAAAAKVTAKQDAGGMDCVTFALFSDVHAVPDRKRQSGRL